MALSVEVERSKDLVMCTSGYYEFKKDAIDVKGYGFVHPEQKDALVETFTGGMCLKDEDAVFLEIQGIWININKHRRVVMLGGGYGVISDKLPADKQIMKVPGMLDRYILKSRLGDFEKLTQKCIVKVNV